MSYLSESQLNEIGVKICNTAFKVQMSIWRACEEGLYPDDLRLAHLSGVSILDASAATHGNVARSADGFASYVNSQLADIPGLFASFAGPNPADFQDAIDDLWKAAYVLSPSLKVDRDGGAPDYPISEKFNWNEKTINQRDLAIAHLSDGWNGDAADAFAGYMEELPSVTQMQYDLSVTLAIGLTARQRLLSRSFDDISKIGKKTVAALAAVGQGDRNQAGIVALTVIGAIAAVVGEVASLGIATPEIAAGEVAAFAFATSSAGLGLASGVMGASIGGVVVPDVISSMRSGITKLIDSMKEETDQLNRILNRVATRTAKVGPNHIGLRAPSPLTGAKMHTRDDLERPSGFYYR